MVREYIRLTFGRRENIGSLTVEYGDWKIRKLTPEEQKEIESLKDELMGFQDFSTAQDLMDDDRREIMAKKKRLMELEALETEGHVEWTIQDKTLIDSVLFIISMEKLPIYVENLPNQLLEKLLSPQIILNLVPFTAETFADATKVEDEEEDLGALQPLPKDPLRAEVVKALRSIDGSTSDGREWEELVELLDTNPAEGFLDGFTTEPGYLYIWPIKYLHDDWGPINIKLKATFTDKRFTWHRAKKKSYWKLKR